MLKLCLQLLVCLTITFRCLALFGRLRRAWLADSLPPANLAAVFRRELRRRGLLMSPPVPHSD